ncbi:uncharacterized PE-PGRS family protein PE_PGRS46-like [Penaeus monodon]|uniref:uncharacterized PE-PGRS family protein PE_PGRS46-like n=1 Tax=Penaeus monodon TaxID=6687 RepID=UPI0018A7DA6F|nr:uncharacterized PE-PGRS family protein PE_PGRS46-like [Penaeus monodon]
MTQKDGPCSGLVMLGRALNPPWDLPLAGAGLEKDQPHPRAGQASRQEESPCSTPKNQFETAPSAHTVIPVPAVLYTAPGEAVNVPSEPSGDFSRTSPRPISTNNPRLFNQLSQVNVSDAVKAGTRGITPSITERAESAFSSLRGSEKSKGLPTDVNSLLSSISSSGSSSALLTSSQDDATGSPGSFTSSAGVVIESAGSHGIIQSSTSIASTLDLSRSSPGVFSVSFEGGSATPDSNEGSSAVPFKGHLISAKGGHAESTRITGSLGDLTGALKSKTTLPGHTSQTGVGDFSGITSTGRFGGSTETSTTTGLQASTKIFGNAIEGGLGSSTRRSEGSTEGFRGYTVGALKDSTTGFKDSTGRFGSSSGTSLTGNFGDSAAALGSSTEPFKGTTESFGGSSIGIGSSTETSSIGGLGSSTTILSDSTVGHGNTTGAFRGSAAGFSGTSPTRGFEGSTAGLGGSSGISSTGGFGGSTAGLGGSWEISSFRRIWRLYRKGPLGAPGSGAPGNHLQEVEGVWKPLRGFGTPYRRFGGGPRPRGVGTL